MARLKKRNEELEETISNNTTFEIHQKFNLSLRQNEFVKLISHKDNNIIIAKGPAGTAKTYLSLFASLQLLKGRQKDKIIYVRSQVESSSRKLGFLPGTEDEKSNVYMLPLFEKCEELLSRSDFKVLVKDKSLEYATTCFMRGRTFNDSIVIIDESQNLTMKEFLTIFTRIGRNSKLIFVGDTAQSDISISDFSKVYQQFSKENDKGIKTFAFHFEDIVRSPIIRYIIETFEGISTK